MSKIITLDEAAVRAVFEGAKEQLDYMVGLYKLVLPNWDDITTINGWPSVNDWTWKAIAQLAMDFDKLHHENVMAGGRWINQGFSTRCGEKLANWQVSLAGIEIHTKSIFEGLGCDQH